MEIVFRKSRRAAVLYIAGLLASACSDGGTPSSGNTPRGSSGANGQSLEAVHGDRGEVTVLGLSPAVMTSVRTFSGAPVGSKPGDDTVTCLYAAPYLTISAAISGRSGDEADLTLRHVNHLGPFHEQDSYDDAKADQAVSLTARLSHDSDSSFFEYRYYYDAVSVPAAYSTCTVDVTVLTSDRVTGQVACQDLFATPRSKDAVSASMAEPRASVTMAFDCPLNPASATGGGTGGAGGMAGASAKGGAAGIGGASGGAGGSGGSAASSGSGGGGGSGGTVSPPKKCGGTPTPCSLLSGSNCSSVKGCTGSGECTGVSRSCYSEFGSYACYSQQGCYWSSSGSGSCGGSSWSCFTFSGDLSCISQDGCFWNDTCKGVAFSCSSFDAITCSSQPGCFLE